MKRIIYWVFVALPFLFFSCRELDKQSSIKNNKSLETQNLYDNLFRIPNLGFLFGHHDDTVYGIGWEGDEGRSDVKSVCGDYPAIISFDLGELELGGTYNLDKVSFEKIKEEIINQYQRGGIVSLSWHVRNPLTGGSAWDTKDTTTVNTILPGGPNHRKFSGWLGKVADFINSLQTEEGTKIPVLFRPWHENTGSWFWWGENLCTPEDYKALWHMTVDTLQARGVNNVLYTYSSGIEPQDTSEYLVRYPGDELIDVIGFDIYQSERETFLVDLERLLTIVNNIGKVHNKVVAITEIGYEGLPDAKWWTETLLPVLKKYSVVYALVWRNARERVTHFYAPYPGQVSAEDFVEFYEDSCTLFVSDVASLYK